MLSFVISGTEREEMMEFAHLPARTLSNHPLNHTIFAAAQFSVTFLPLSLARQSELNSCQIISVIFCHKFHFTCAYVVGREDCWENWQRFESQIWHRKEHGNFPEDFLFSLLLLLLVVSLCWLQEQFVSSRVVVVSLGDDSRFAKIPFVGIESLVCAIKQKVSCQQFFLSFFFLYFPPTIQYLSPSRVHDDRQNSQQQPLDISTKGHITSTQRIKTWHRTEMWC